MQKLDYKHALFLKTMCRNERGTVVKYIGEEFAVSTLRYVNETKVEKDFRGILQKLEESDYCKIK